MNYNYIIIHLLILYYFIILYYITLIILHPTFTLLFTYNLFKGNNGKVKLEKSRLSQLDNSRRKPCERG